MIERLQHLMDVEITLTPYKGQNRYGELYGDDVSVKARIERGYEEVEGIHGESLVGQYKVILGEAINIDPRDRITLPKEFGSRNTSGDFETVQPKILSVRPVYFRGRHDHTVLICG